MKNRLVTDETLIALSPDLVRPCTLRIDDRHTELSARDLVLTAQCLATFWHTGDVGYLERAAGEPVPMPAGPGGTVHPLAGWVRSSAVLRSWLPDLECELLELLVVGADLALRLRLHGHIAAGVGDQSTPPALVEAVAVELHRVELGRIVDSRRVSDELVSLTRAGARPGDGPGWATGG